MKLVSSVLVVASAVSFFLSTACLVRAGGADDGKPIGTAVLTAEEEQQWWATLSVAEQSQLATMFEPGWYASQPPTTQIAYAFVAQTLYDFLSTPGNDSRPDDSYTSFAPLLLRASFHAAGTFHAPSGTGGTNGGSIFTQGEQDDDGNACIGQAVEELETLLNANPRVSLADAMVIGGSVALDVMDFPRMDLLQITGGRTQITGLAWRDRLPNPDFNPTELFKESYNLTATEFTALIGGGHNFGSAHGVCSGYVGDWTKNPLSWKSVEDPNGSEFFVDLLKDDWRWYEVCTYHNGTSMFTSISDPFAPGAVEEEDEEDGEEELDVCEVRLSEIPFICEAQAMRGCDFEDGMYEPNAPEIIGCQFRLKSDFFLKADPVLLPLSESFAEDDDLLAEEFGLAYHKLTHAGLRRCGLSGFGCQEGQKCMDVFEEETGAYLSSYCSSMAMDVIDDTTMDYSDASDSDNTGLEMIDGEDGMIFEENVSSSNSDSDSSSSFSLGTGGSIACIIIMGFLALWVVALMIILNQTNKEIMTKDKLLAEMVDELRATDTAVGIGDGHDQIKTKDSTTSGSTKSDESPSTGVVSA